MVETRRLGRSGESISVIGMGTYYDSMETSPDAFPKSPIPDLQTRVAGLKKGLELGLRFIDTAEVYRTEPLVAAALEGRSRDEVFIATKVWPSHLSYDELIKAAERSLARLKTGYIDLYQIHWPSSRVPIRESMRAMETLVQQGKVRYIGVSNFSVEQTKEVMESLSKNELISNQIEYSLLARDAEKDIIPFCEANGIAIIAYRPLSKGQLAFPRGALKVAMDTVSHRHDGKTYAQIALNWLKEKSNAVFPIPRISTEARAVEDAGAAGWSLGPEELAVLERAV